MSEVIKLVKESTMRDIAEAIKTKEGTQDRILVAEMAQRISDLPSGGEGIPVEAIRGINLFSLNDFGKSKVELNLPNLTTLSQFLYFTNTTPSSVENTTVEELTINSDGVITTALMFMCMGVIGDKKLKKIILNIDFSSCTNFANFMTSMSALEEVGGIPIDLSSATSIGGGFISLISLREIRFQGEIKVDLPISHSNNLSKDTILNVFSCLSDNVSGKTFTVRKVAVNKAFETSEGANDGVSSAEWTALVDSKPNWNISLS